MLRKALATTAAVAVGAAVPAPGTSLARPSRTSWDGCTRGSGDIRFRAADGARLVGHRFGTEPTAVVLAHETRGSLCSWLQYARRLAALGYTAFPFDYRNYGDSQKSAASARWGGDIAAAVRAVHRLGATKVFVLGASLGGSAALKAAADTRAGIDGVISVSGAADLADALAAAGRLRVPSLYVAGELDEPFDDDARRLYSATAAETALTIVDRGEHGVRLVAVSAVVRTAIEAFLRSH
jgi:dienelactone hydrolase